MCHWGGEWLRNCVSPVRRHRFGDYYVRKSISREIRIGFRDEDMLKKSR